MFSEFVSFTPFGFVESDLFFIFVGFSLLAASPFIAFWLIEKHRTMRAQLIAAIILMPATLFWCFMTASLIAEGLSNITQSLTLLFHIVGPAFLSVSLVALLIMHWVRNRRVLNAADA
jgi:hypothetical protein